MRLPVQRFVIFVIAGSCVAAATAVAADLKSPLAKIELTNGDCMVFLGDSITHQCLYTQYVEDYFYTRMPKQRFTFHNAGVGGAQAWDALQRFERDVAAYKPKYVTVLLGMNDGHYQPFDQTTFDRYRKDMTELVDRITDIGATPVLITPTMFDSRAARQRENQNWPPPATLEFYNSVLSYYGSWLREVALLSGFGFVDMYHPLNHLTWERRKTDAGFTMIKDAVHPGPAGQVVMAYSIVSDMGLPRQVSNIRITIRKNGKAEPVVKGGTLSDLAVSDDGLEFTFTANSLPWVLPEDAQLGVELTKLGNRMNREALQVHGLPAGRYRLSIDGNVVRRYTAVALARHVELQSNAKTPQHQQAREVATLNKKRNEGPVRALRGEWSTFQGHSRSADRLTKDPQNEELQKRVADLAKRLEGREERIAQREQEAKELEEEIFRVNQPKPRRYVLKRMN